MRDDIQKIRTAFQVVRKVLADLGKFFRVLRSQRGQSDTREQNTCGPLLLQKHDGTGGG
jgi:hypothetical protein